ncbi:hypothetical protein L210DRAFT_3507091 [Boletus edulis BED1]|uniref:Uncharacterized protein n=1 Tax=Boletus edulis BED1 TaxID=1328754 RepID=A0AAD4BKT9_BOLED|nr:hypothetical protein L210DRAFT_3507091 [Boletus edulis BED1]
MTPRLVMSFKLVSATVHRIVDVVHSPASLEQIWPFGLEHLQDGMDGAAIAPVSVSVWPSPLSALLAAFVQAPNMCVLSALSGHLLGVWTQDESHPTLEHMAADMKQFHNQHVHPGHKYPSGDLVLLEATNISLNQPSYKLRTVQDHCKEVGLLFPINQLNGSANAFLQQQLAICTLLRDFLCLSPRPFPHHFSVPSGDSYLSGRVTRSTLPPTPQLYFTAAGDNTVQSAQYYMPGDHFQRVEPNPTQSCTHSSSASTSQACPLTSFGDNHTTAWAGHPYLHAAWANSAQRHSMGSNLSDISTMANDKDVSQHQALKEAKHLVVFEMLSRVGWPEIPTKKTIATSIWNQTFQEALNKNSEITLTDIVATQMCTPHSQQRQKAPRRPSSSP